MPYISQEERKELDPFVDKLIEALRKSPPDRLDARLNYVVYKMLVRLYSDKYFDYNRTMGVLSCIAHEFYRRKVATYEDRKIQETGDII
jgi:hypothetical protein